LLYVLVYIAFISPVSKSGKQKCQATRFLAACQYPWITGSLVSCKEHYIEHYI